MMTLNKPAAGIEIREATKDDLAAIMELERACFANDAWDLATMRSEVIAKHTGRTAEQVQQDSDRDFYLSASEA
jgi:ATP-dependent protease ClpP protease subunit